MPEPPRRSVRSVVRAGAIDLRPLRRHRSFRILWLGQLISMLGRQVTVVALPYQLYAITGSTLAVGVLGLVQVVPLVSTALVGGAIADRVDRRRLLLVTNSLLAACSLTLAVAARVGTPPAALLFVIAGLIAAFGAVDQPARSATVPNLVDRDLLPSALALMFGLFQVTLVAGPAVAGLLIARVGLGTAYVVDVATFGAALTAIALLPAQPRRDGPVEPPLRSIGTGLRYLATRRDVIGGFAIDLDAMVFGMPRALFPVLAATTYHTGPQGLGLLYSAPGVGGLVAVVAGSGVARLRRLGRVVVIAVLAWGAAITVAGLFRELWPALVLLAVAGAADSLSAVCRTAMLQASTPDHLRGRLSSAYSMVVMGGPYLGDIESGAVGAAVGPAASVVSGGLLCIVGAGVVAALFPQLWRYDAHTAAGGGWRPVDPPG